MSNEVKFGIISILTIAMIIFGLNYMAGSKLFGPPLTLHADYQNVDGLLSGNPVTLNGLQVGRVADMQMDPSSKSIRVSLTFDREMNIPDNAEAMIYSADLLGNKGVQIWMADSTIPSQTFYQDNQEITGTMETGILDVGRDLVETQGAAILIEVGKLAVELNEIVKLTKNLLLDQNNSSSLRASLGNIQATTENLTSITSEVDSLAKELKQTAVDARSIVANVEGNNENIDNILSNVKNTTDSLVEASVQVKELMTDASDAVSTVESMVSKLDTTSGTLGLLLNDRQLYDSLTNTTENVNAVLRELRKNPGRFVDDIKIYVFESGKKYKNQKKQEKEAAKNK
ncbi:MAG: MlaD family protein [Bacteroidota bacterium]